MPTQPPLAETRGDGPDSRVFRAPSLHQVVRLHALRQLGLLIRPAQIWPLLATFGALVVLTGLSARYNLEDRRAAIDLFNGLGVTLVTLLAIGYGTSAVRAASTQGAFSLYLLRPRGSFGWPVGTFCATGGLLGLGAAVTAASVWGTAAVVAMQPELGHLLPMTASAGLTALAWTAIAMAVAAFSQRGPVWCVLWWVVIDQGMARAVDSLAWITPGPASAALSVLPEDPAIVAAGAGMACLQLLAVTLVALVLFQRRVHRTPPTK